MMLIRTDEGTPKHTGSTRPHYELMPSKRDVDRAAIKIIASLTEKAAENCDEEINILRRALCLPTS